MLFNRSTGKPRTIPAISRECSPHTDDMLSLDSLIAWLEQRPADGAYDYSSASKCLLHQYFTAKGLKELLILPCQYTCSPHLIHSLPEGWEEIAFGSPFLTKKEGRWTFGQALQRAKALKYRRAA